MNWKKQLPDSFSKEILNQSDLTYVSNARHIALLHKAHATIEDALGAAEAGVPVDMIQIDVTTDMGNSRRNYRGYRPRRFNQ